MPERRRYERTTMLSVVMAADMVGVVAAAEQSGIPESTIRYWAEKPEFAEYRAKAREDMEHEVAIVAHLAWQRVAEALRENRLEPRDALFAADKATTLYQLVSGQATVRTENREILHDFADGEKEALEDWLHEIAKERADVA
jgi:Asp-tRNA(Asn)/Glu-tRNA(Gln) amidotransferase B subunit